ncbi:MAG: acyl-CoA thioester hydrolase [Candidatus Paceibacteria bacterium]|jgi:acyl-CoA thioester hydrolase
MPSTPHRLRLRVRYGETDQMGVVHHANYLTYFEEGRTSLMADMGLSYGELERSGIGLPVRKIDIRYRAPALYEDALCVETRVTAMRAASVTFGYAIIREADETLLVTGSSELACISLVGERSVTPLPPDLRQALEGCLGPPSV